MESVLRTFRLGIVAGLLISCSDSTEPAQPGSESTPTPVSVGDTVTSLFHTDDSVHRYLLQDPAGGDVAIFLLRKARKTPVCSL